MRHMIRILIILVSTYLLVCVAAFLFQRKLIFIPSRCTVPEPAQLGLDAERVEIEVKDGVRLVGWWARNQDSPYTLIWCHGNAGNILYRSDEFKAFLRAGFNLLLFDYRGYGESTGSPSVKGLEEDTLAVYDYLVAQGVAGEKIISYGRSIGSGPAAYLAHSRKVAGLVLVQPLTSTLEMGKRSFPFLPVGLFLTEIIDNKTALSRYDGPLLILHGDRDDIVPYEMGQELHRISASRHKRFVTLEGGDHNNLGSTHKKELLSTIRAWMDTLSP